MNRLGTSLIVAALVAFLVFAAFGPRVLAERAGAPAIEVKTEPKRDFAQFMQSQMDYDGTDDPKTKLIEVLDELATQHNVRFHVNEAAFEAEGINDVLNTPLVTNGRPVPKFKNTRVDRILRKVLSRVARANVPGDTPATFILRDDVIEITTRRAVLLEVYGDNPHRALPLAYAEFDKMPLEDALKELAHQSEFNILIDPRPAEKTRTGVTAKLKNVPLDSAVQLLADMADLKAVLQDNVLYVTTKDNAKVVEAENRKRNESEPRAPVETPKPRM
jgi:hypothetical protein